MTAGEGGVAALERRCRRLLLAYPASYRAEHGDELLGTLLETAAPDQRRPGRRESMSLILGGLKARSAQNRRLSTRANLRLAAMLALATYTAFQAARTGGGLLVFWGPPAASPAVSSPSTGSRVSRSR